MSGYTKKLYILTFDHRGSLNKVLFGKKMGLNSKQQKMIGDYKKVIFEGFLNIWNQLGRKEECGVFVDSEYCQNIIKKAKRKKISLAVAVEKSGRKEFGFEHGQEFSQQIMQIKPDFVKALVRYNPRDKKVNTRQLGKLKKLNGWCMENDYKLIIELLAPAGEVDLRKAMGNKEVYDSEIRPRLTVTAIQEFHQAGINPDIWKIEAMESKKLWKPIIKAAREGKRKKTGIIMLGRGESVVKVKDWIQNCPKDKVNGFAIGRTVWLRAISDLHQGRINKKEAVRQIADNYLEFIKLWENGN